MVRAFSGVVGATCTPVMAKFMLFTITTVTSRFLLAAWIRWFPPMEAMSPSPAKITTGTSGFIIFTPVAHARVLPCTPWNMSVLIYTGIRAVHPTPAMCTIRPGSMPSSSRACM